MKLHFWEYETVAKSLLITFEDILQTIVLGCVNLAQSYNYWAFVDDSCHEELWWFGLLGFMAYQPL